MDQAAKSSMKTKRQLRPRQVWIKLGWTLLPVIIIAAILLNATVIDPVVDDPKAAAEIILKGIDKYYAKHGEYPPYLLGETPPLRWHE